MLARFRERWPNISVSLTGQPLEHDLGAMVRNGLLDLAFIDVSTVEAPLAAVELLVGPYVVLLPASSPLASRPALDLAELGDYDLISGAMDDPCSARLNQAFGALDRQPNIVFRTDDNLTIQRLVGVGLGGAVVAKLTVEPQIDGPRVVRVPLAPTSRIERRIGIVWHRRALPVTSGDGVRRRGAGGVRRAWRGSVGRVGHADVQLGLPSHHERNEHRP